MEGVGSRRSKRRSEKERVEKEGLGRIGSGRKKEKEKEKKKEKEKETKNTNMSFLINFCPSRQEDFNESFMSKLTSNEQWRTRLFKKKLRGKN